MVISYMSTWRWLSSKDGIEVRGLILMKSLMLEDKFIVDVAETIVDVVLLYRYILFIRIGLWDCCLQVSKWIKPKRLVDRRIEEYYHQMEERIHSNLCIEFELVCCGKTKEDSIQWCRDGTWLHAVFKECLWTWARISNIHSYFATLHSWIMWVCWVYISKGKDEH